MTQRNVGTKKLYKPIKFKYTSSHKRDRLFKKLVVTVKSRCNDESLEKNTRFFNLNKPHLVPLKSVRSHDSADCPALKEVSPKPKKRLPFIGRLYAVTERIKKYRLGDEYKYDPRISLYQGKAHKFNSKLTQAANLLSAKADRNLSTYIKMHKRSNLNLTRVTTQRLKRKIFFGLSYNPETRYSLALRKKYLKKKTHKFNIHVKRHDEKPIINDTVRNSNNLPINIGNKLRSNKLRNV